MALDVRDAKYSKEQPEKGSKRERSIKARWWEVPEGDLATAVTDAGKDLRDRSADRHAMFIRWARLYENCEFDSFTGRDYATSMVRQALTGVGVMSLNVGASCVDTLTAKVTKNRPRPMFLTSGGSWDMQIKARNLDRFMRGFFYDTKLHRESRSVFVDSCEFGTGFGHFFPAGDKKLGFERVTPNEILVDDLDGQYGSPRQMFRMKLVDTDVLKRLFPKKAQEIDDASKDDRASFDVDTSEDVAENTVEVWEAWHLPSGEGAKDGKHVIAINNCVLFEEGWRIDKFPFVPLRFKRRTTGFWGKGVIETVHPIQVELNRVVRSISLQMQRKGKGRTFVQVGSKVVASHLTNNDGGDIVQYVGAQPVVDNQNAIAQEEFNYVLQLRQQAFQEVGISELSAAAKKPSGLDAAVALREYNDIESERFAPQHQEWEQYFLDCADLAIDLISKQHRWKSYKVKVPGKRDLTEVDWAEVDIERDAFVMQMWPVSSLPQTPAARYQKVKEMMQDGFIEKPVAQRLLEFPDIEAESNLGNAMIDDADATISAILDADKPEVPTLEPYQNFDLIIQRANAAYLYARHRGCSEERLMLLRQLIDSATQQKVKMMAPAPMPGTPPMPGAPSVAAPPLPGGGANITNTLNVPPPVVPMTPPVVG